MVFINRVSRFTDFVRFLYDKLFQISDFFKVTNLAILHFSSLRSQFLLNETFTDNF